MPVRMSKHAGQMFNTFFLTLSRVRTAYAEY